MTVFTVCINANFISFKTDQRNQDTKGICHGKKTTPIKLFNLRLIAFPLSAAVACLSFRPNFIAYGSFFHYNCAIRFFVSVLVDAFYVFLVSLSSGYSTHFPIIARQISLVLLFWFKVMIQLRYFENKIFEYWKHNV